MGCQGGHIYGANNKNGQWEGVGIWPVIVGYANNFGWQLPSHIGFDVEYTIMG